MHHDVVIIGAGPVGLEVAAACERYGLSYVQIERYQIGQTIYDWPRHVRFFSSPERMAIAGMPFHTPHQDLAPREEYLAYLRSVAEFYDLNLRLYETVSTIEPIEGGYRVGTHHTYDTSDTESYDATRIVLAVGDMARPRRLGIPGEDLPTVSHSLEDPHQYFRQRLLIVGGRNTAVEAAVRCFRAGVDVSVSYRGGEFDRKRVYSRLHLEISMLTGKGKVTPYYRTVPVEIKPRSVVLETVDTDYTPTGKRREIGTDFVLLATGYEADYALLDTAGVEISAEDGRICYNDETMETNVPGIYIAGTTERGRRTGFSVFVGTSHEHTRKIMAHILGKDDPWEIVAGSTRRRNYPFNSKDIQSE
jgi:thioredoxin reductase (NADPH)